jgi:cytochrome c oxidase subunit 1
VFAFFGGLHYWWPKITGKMYREKLAVTAFIFLFIGFNVTFLTQFVLGARGMPRRYYDYIPEFQTLHMTSTVGSWLLGVGFLVMFYMFVTSLISGPKAPRNPWRSAGYEWMTPTPPPLENFPEQPHFHRGPYDYDLATEAELAED